MSQKKFQILSILNSEFCLGDQSGVQALIHFFNKKVLIVNNIPFGQLTHNSVVLPRLWIKENGASLNLEDYLGEAIYRIHPFKNKKDENITPRSHEPSSVLETVKEFVESIEKKGRVSGIKSVDLLTDNSDTMLKFAKQSYYSPIFFNKISSS
jgi:putative glycosyltransferase (TIGR04372 family)